MDYEKLLFRKEYAQLYDVPDPSWDSYIDAKMRHEHKIMKRSYQTFISRHINPNSKASRLIVKQGTGSGKTIGSLGAAMEFIKFFKLQGQESQILVLSFQKNIFIDELTRSEDYGFITKEELQRKKDLQKIHHENELKNFESRIKRRITNVKYGGYFRFLGYREFFNALFYIPDKLWREYGRTNVNQDNNREYLYFKEDVLLENIKNGIIKVNTDLLESVCNSLIICDEIHNVYNSQELNSYGFAIKYVLDHYDLLPPEEKINKKVSALFLTATIANNSASEVIDILNLAIPTSATKSSGRLHKSDFFDDKGFLLPGALEQLQEHVGDYVSFLINMNPKIFPKKIYVGEVIKIPTELLPERNPIHTNNEIPYLKFMRAKMSDFHQKIYDDYTLNGDKKKVRTLNVNTIILNDIALPIPSGFELSGKNIMSIYSLASDEFMAEHEIILTKNPIINKAMISGGIFKRENLAKYSTKYSMMLDTLDSIGREKVFIAHPQVQYGVLIIQEILRENGYIDHMAPHTNNTRCAICNVIFENHSNISSPNTSIGNATKNIVSLPNTSIGKENEELHEFIPARFISLYGGMNDNMLKTLKYKYNSPQNTHGELYKILLGSRIVFEGADFKAIRHLMIMSFPMDISTIIQILGRGARDGSHSLLPPDEQNIRFYIYVSSVASTSSTSKTSGRELSYEERRYFEKMEDYLTIQLMEKVINANSIDAVLNYNYTSKVNDPLILMPFRPSEKFGKWLRIIDKQVQLSTLLLDERIFEVYYSNTEVSMIVYVIKRLLLEVSPVFEIDDLFEYVKNTKFAVHINMNLIDFENFLLAVDLITGTHINMHSSQNLIESLFSDDKKIVTHNGTYIIALIKDYIMLLPFKPMQDYQSLGVNLNMINNSYISSTIDYNSYMRGETKERFTKYDVTDKLLGYKVSYEELKYKFYIEFKGKDLMKVQYFSEIYNLEFHQRLIEDTIIYVFYVMINKDMSFSEMHEFYFQLLYLYYRLNLVIFAADVKNTNYYKFYEPYVLAPDEEFYFHLDKELAELNPLLLSSYTGISGSFNMSRIKELLGSRPQSFMSQTSGLHFVNIKYQISQINTINKVPENILPIGHFLTQKHQNNVPELFIVESNSWMRFHLTRIELPETENDIIVGYLEQDPMGIQLIFKVREKSMEQHRDKRLAAKGMTCTSKDKAYLIRKLNELGIDTTKNTIIDICEALKLELIRREIKAIKEYAHTKKNKIRWFYFHYESPNMKKY